MANLTIHNVKTVLVHGNTHSDFCTLKFDIMSQYADGTQPFGGAWETVELYFNSTEDRKSFIESISEAGI